MTTPRGPAIRSRPRRAAAPAVAWQLACAVVVVCAFAAVASSARAGEWIQVSCANPDGSAAPSEGWSDGSIGSPGAGITSTQCAPGTPMQATLSELAPAGPNSGVYLEYQPPPGSALVGGQVDATLSADGYHSSGTSGAAAFAHLSEPTQSDEFFQCVAFFQTCGPSPDYSGAITLPSDAGGVLYAEAGCTSGTGNSCDENGNNSTDWARVEIDWTRLLLASSVSPQATGFNGSGVERNVRGTGHVVFTASEPYGPGIYQTAVSLDGRLAWTGTPDTNSGECVPVGTDAATGALMFDHQQPCLDTEVVDAPVPTAGLPDGRHELAITVKDAAGNSSTVLDQTITTSNPQVTPAATGRGAIHAAFVISWSWNGTRTRLRSISVRRLPRNGRLTVSCTGTGCPRLKIRSEPARRAAKLLAGLMGRTLRVGDRLRITVTAPHRRAEHVRLEIRSNQIPLARLVKR